MTQERPKKFTQEQVKILKKCASSLLHTLEHSKCSESEQLLEGGLRKILTHILESNELEPSEEIPFFSLMTRDYLPEEETRQYLDFYSMAMYGELAYRD